MTEIEKNIEKILDHQFAKPFIQRYLNKAEIKEIDDKYKITLTFYLKRFIKIFLDKIISFLRNDNFTLIKSRKLDNVKNKYDKIAGTYIDNLSKDKKLIAQL